MLPGGLGDDQDVDQGVKDPASREDPEQTVDYCPKKNNI